MKTPLEEIEEWTGHNEPPWWPGLLAVLIMAIVALICVFCIGCGYPVTLSLHTDYGKASYSAKGWLEVIIEK